MLFQSPIFTKLKKFLLDVFFPIACVSCEKPNEWICEECLNKIPLKKIQVCPVCEKSITPDGRVCFACQKKSFLNGLLAASYYYKAGIMSSQPRKYQFIASLQKIELVSKMIHYYKYRFVQDLHVPLGKIIIKSFSESQLALPDLIIPVPLHSRRLRWRGFNQAGLLAEYLGQNIAPGFPIPVRENFLVRQKYTFPQMKVKDHKKRKRNIQGAFGIKTEMATKNFLRGKNILLVDDVATTGATLFECARVLKKAGASEVFGLVVARQEINGVNKK